MSQPLRHPLIGDTERAARADAVQRYTRGATKAPAAACLAIPSVRRDRPMSYRGHDYAARRDGVTIPTIWLAVALSLLLHVAVLWRWLPQLQLLSLDKSKHGPADMTLMVQLAPRTSVPSSAPAAVPSSPARPASPSAKLRTQPQKKPLRRPPRSPVIALRQPARDDTAPPTTQPTAVAQPREGDLASYIEAKRRARAQSAAAAAPASVANATAAEDDDARSKRIVAANLGLENASAPGGDQAHSGGIFQIRSIGYNEAEFMFFGWKKDISRNTNQLIEVRKGNNSDIRIAVVRRMIAIIRDYESEDFLWKSRRLGRELTLSARAADNAGLEEFMMKEFFDATRPP